VGDRSNESAELVPAAGFNVRDYARTAVGSHRSEIDADAFVTQPLKPETLRVLRYLIDIEQATMSHLRNVLVTATHKDARVTAFLGTWAFEKFWIADAFTKILEAHGPEFAEPTDHKRNIFARIGVRLAPITGSIAANRAGEDMIAVHMTMGAIDEWLTQAAYARAIELDPHSELVKMVTTVTPIAERQLSFFEASASDRLARSEGARVLTRKRMSKAVWPIGAEAQPTAETDFFFRYLFETAPAIVDEIDARVAALPGLDGLAPIRRATPGKRGTRND